ELRNLVEPALARWDYRPARAVWRERLRDPIARPQDLLLAIRGLGAVCDERALGLLRELVLADLDREVKSKTRRETVDSSIHPSSFILHPSLRLEAARVLGALRTEGLEKDAERLAAETG